jgi:hypothetical protein
VGSIAPIFARPYSRAVLREPNPYITLLQKFVEEASLKYLGGQLTSATVYDFFVSEHFLRVLSLKPEMLYQVDRYFMSNARGISVEGVRRHSPALSP